MDSKEKEARDHRFEEFVLDQVKRFGIMEEKVSTVFVMCSIACIVMCVIGIFTGRPFFKCIYVGIWSPGFYAASRFYKEDAASVKEAAAKIRAAIDDPDFDIPDDYPDDILGIRQLVCPTLKNVITQAIAYGIIAVTCWAGSIIILMVCGMDGELNVAIFVAGLVMGGMALMLTFLSARAIKDIPVAKAYEQYLNDVAAGE